ncbi:hypothetical protein O7605_18280 [Verrucosispora sp. WMMA2121]|uniref:hypothetical protein n=1 Tax=Verrucosispora sp. WMMA2121 TaxID=3015164 RepID=UPI0022B5F020|nr:hypothetical protein [Verrucosispora sp. WMMA2121]MCZ7421456.1 hypothetical protein [Verrucosispora sp. WMMA2121]
MRSVRSPGVRVGRSAMALAVAASAVAFGAPAHAESGSGWFQAQLDDVVIGASGAPGKVKPLYVYAQDTVNPRVVVDLGDLAGVATAEFPAWCAAAGTQVTCPLPPDVDPTASLQAGSIPVLFRPADGATRGDSASVVYQALADNAEPWVATATVSVSDGADLVNLGDGRVDSAAVGDRLAAPVRLTNLGNRTSRGVRVTFTLSSGLTPSTWSNCWYAPLAGHRTSVVCDLTGRVRPGTTMEVPGGFGFEIGSSAYAGESLDQFVEPLAGAAPLPAELGYQRPEGGTELKLRTSRTTSPAARTLTREIDPSDNWASFYVDDVPNSLDLAALAEPVVGPVGGSAVLRAGVGNNGAGSLDDFRSGAGEVAPFYLRVPAGVTVESVPASCFALYESEDGWYGGEPLLGATRYRCAVPSSVFAAGETYQVDFGVRITAAGGEAGAVSLNAPGPYRSWWDDDADNDEVPVVVYAQS